jgi:hypothetical protein
MNGNTNELAQALFSGVFRYHLVLGFILAHLVGKRVAVIDEDIIQSHSL